MTIPRIEPHTMGMSVGVVSALSTLSVGLLAHSLLADIPVYVTIGTQQIHYQPSLENCFIYAGLGLLYGWIGGEIVARLYNRFGSRFH